MNPTRAPWTSLLLMATLFCAPGNAANPVSFDGGRALDHVRALVGFGPRPPGSAAIEQSREYIRTQLGAAGIPVADQRFDATTPLGMIPMVNLRATIPGQRPDRLIIGGHYDTKLFRQFRFVGANDGGSSTAFLLELGRVLKARKNPLTIEIVFFDGEEAFIEWHIGNDNTYGSRHYVEAAQRSGEIGSIKAMILVDMIGDRDLNIRRETLSTPWLTDLIWKSAKATKMGSYFLDQHLEVEDDHVPFLRAGVPAVNIIDLDYPPWHTPDDTLDKVSARSMDIVATVLLDALPKIEARLLGATR